MALTLYIGNKNYSSWSLRAWLTLRAAQIPFEEVLVPLDFDTAGSAFRERIGKVSPAGRVPVLVDDGFAVWDTLAIAEYAAEKFPQHGIWPADAQARARARSLCAEMHSGFGALRSACPMNIEADLTDVGPRLMQDDAALRSDLRRIEQLWTEARQAPSARGGALLFGRFSAADAFFAPVVWRIVGYGLPLGATARAYADALLALPAMQEWAEAARVEHLYLAEDEPYRELVGGTLRRKPVAG